MFDEYIGPSKNIGGKRVDTYAFNITVLFLSSFLLYLILHFDLLSVTVKKIDRYLTENNRGQLSALIIKQLT